MERKDNKTELMDYNPYNVSVRMVELRIIDEEIRFYLRFFLGCLIILLFCLLL